MTARGAASVPGRPATRGIMRSGSLLFPPGDAVLESTRMAYDQELTGGSPKRLAVSGQRAACHFARN